MQRNLSPNLARLVRWSRWLLAAVLLLSACQSPISTPAPTQQPPEAATETPVPPEAPAPVLPTETTEPTGTPTPAVSPSPTATLAPKTIHDTENILVMGVDQRPGDRAWRTDTIMVVAIDYDGNQVGIVNFPRDLWIEIPGYGMGRINQVDFQGEQQKYPGGGPALLSKILKDDFGVQTKSWVRIKQEGLVELVDALGGVTVTLDCPFHEITPHPTIEGEYQSFDLPAGKVLLNGLDAKKFATYRYNSSDFSRAKRQQQLIWAIRDRALEIDALPRIPELWRALSKTFKTDLSLLDVIRLARLGSQLGAKQVHGLVFSTKAITYAVVGGGAQVLKVADEDALQQELNGLFAAVPIAQQGREGTGKCPATPTPTIDPAAVPAETAAPEATAAP